MKKRNSQKVSCFVIFEKKIRSSKYLLIFIFFLFSPVSSPLTAQDFGVWIATAMKIDFPKTSGKENQTEELKELVETAHNKGITTLYFQIRGRGDSFYQSEMEPWSESLTGTLGKNPGWDPLAEIIDLAKERNMKVIGWFNVYKIADKSNQIKSQSRIKHVAEAHPEWVLKSGSEKFLNPGIPEVRSFIASIAEDVISGYDLDGLQLDFCRYPTTKYNDSKTVRKYKPSSQSADDWRRQNITQTVELIRKAITSKNSKIILGAAPLGICKSVPKAKGLQSYFEVYQDSYGWMEENLIDEMVPQIYWPIGNIADGTGAKTSPDFETLCYAWKENSNGKSVKAGIALYKKPVYDQAKRLVETALKAGHDGVVFYAWQQFKDLNLDLNQFKTKNKNEPIQEEKEPKIQNISGKFRFEKITETQILLYNDDSFSAESFEITDDEQVVKLNGKLNKEHVVLLTIDSTMKSVKIKNSSGENIAILNLR